MQVLLVLPDLGSVAAAGVALRSRFDVAVATTAVEALRSIPTSRRSLAMIDLRVSDLDGVLLLTAIRARNPACHVAVLGASARPSLLARAVGVGVSDVRPDPFRIDTVPVLAGQLTAGDGDPRQPPPFSRAVASAVLHVGHHYREPLTVESLSQAVAISPSRLAHLFRADLGLAPHDFVRRVRIFVAKHFLASTLEKLERVADLAGFCDASHLTRALKADTMLTPGAFRRLGVPGRAFQEIPRPDSTSAVG